MNIKKYVGYFHDGNLININHHGNIVELFIESSQIEENEIDNKETLSKTSTLKGILYLINVKNIKLEDKKYEGILTKIYDDGEILDLEIQGNKILLLVEWKNFPPKVRTSDVSKIEIEADEIYWKNIPTLNE